MVCNGGNGVEKGKETWIKRVEKYDGRRTMAEVNPRRGRHHHLTIEAITKMVPRTKQSQNE
jgi:hypothetical protein